MRKTRKFLLALLLAAFALSLGLFAAACDDGESGVVPPPVDETAYLVSFDENGGSYATGKPDPIRVKEGESLLEAVRSVAVPTKPGVTFGNWFLDGAELNATVKMPANDILLVAQYKVEYTIESYRQNASRNSYIKEAETVGSGYVGTSVSPEAPAYSGFELNPSPEGQRPVPSVTLSENASDNVVRFYYDRRLFSVLFDGGAEGAEGEMETIEQYYGLTVSLPENLFSYAGHRFAGWATSADGEAEYPGQGLLTVLGNVRLYAVWDRGYQDRYGGEDMLFFPSQEPQKAILSRGGQEFEGTRDGDSFLFTTPAGTELKGKIYQDYFFSYERADLAGTYIFYANTPDPDFPKDRLYDENRTLTISSYMTAVYEDNGRRSEGYVRFSDETGDYVFESAGESFRFLPANFTKDENHPYEHIFSVGGGEGNVYDDFVWIDRNAGSGFLANTMSLLLDGYSTAALIVSIDENQKLYFDGRYFVTGTIPMGDSVSYLVTCFFEDDLQGSLSGVAGATVQQFLYTIDLSGNGSEVNGFVIADRFRGEFTGDPEGSVSIGGQTVSLKDAHIVLDGFGPFENSAVCTIGGTTYRGSYEINSDLVSGSVLTVYYGGSSSFELMLDPETFTATSTRVQKPHTEFHWMDGNALHPPYLFLYEEDYTDGASVLGKRMEVWLPEDDVLVRVAEGYCTTEFLGAYNDRSFSLYTFHRTWVKEGYEYSQPTEIGFYNSTVTSTIDYTTYFTYCLLTQTFVDESGESTEHKLYRTVTVEGGGEIWVCDTVNTTGLGALYFTGGRSGTVYEGQFTSERSENFDHLVGSFLYATPDGYAVTLSFNVEEAAGNDLHAIPLSMPETMLYILPETGPETAGRDVLFLDGGELAKSATSTDGVNFSYVGGTYAAVDETEFGETVYAFYTNGREEFRFVICTIPGDDYDGVLFAAKKSSVLTSSVYTADEGATLRLDLYHAASIEAADGRTLYGSYYLTDLGGGSIVFLDEDGIERKYFLFDDGSFQETDWAIGRDWQLLDNNSEQIGTYLITFNGNGSATLRSSSSDKGTDIQYRPLGTYNELFGYEEYLLMDVSFGSRYPRGNYKVTFMFNMNGIAGCMVYNVNAGGIFIDDEWNVLTLDGYTRATVVTSAYTATGTFTVEDFDRKFLSLQVEDGTPSMLDTTLYFVLGENHTFFSTNYEELANQKLLGLFFADDFSTVSLRTDGTAYIGTKSGPYFVEQGEDGTYRAYIYTASTPTVIELKKEGFTFLDKKYHLFEGDVFTAEGIVYLLNEGEQISESSRKLEASLSFVPNMETNASRAATFVLKGQGEGGADLTDDGFLISLYASSEEDDLFDTNTDRALSPVVSYGRHSYPISFSYDGSKFTFKVKAGYHRVQYLDHQARYYENEPSYQLENGEHVFKGYINRGMRFFKEYFGFGPISEGEVTISGDFLYLYDENSDVYSKPVHFEGVKESEIYKVGYVPSYKDRFEFLFHGSDGKEYALNYYEWFEGGIYFWCYGLYTYQDFETDGYTVRAKSLVYTKLSTAPGFLDAAGKEPNYAQTTSNALGKITNVTLFDKSKNGAPIVAYDTGCLLDGYGEGVWLVELDSVVEQGTTETCAWGDGYLVTFTKDGSGNVTGANVEKYAFAQVVNYQECLVNLFIDENGTARIVGFAVFNADGGRYDWLGNSHAVTGLEDGSVTFLGNWDGSEVRYTVKVEKADDVTIEQDGETIVKDGYTVTVSSSV